MAINANTEFGSTVTIPSSLLNVIKLKDTGQMSAARVVRRLICQPAPGFKTEGHSATGNYEQVSRKLSSMANFQRKSVGNETAAEQYDVREDIGGN